MSSEVGAPAFLMFSGTNDRAVIALARVMTQCGVGFGIVARDKNDKILISRYARNVVHIRQTDSLTPEDFIACLLSSRRSVTTGCLTTVVPISEFFNRASFRARDHGLPSHFRFALGDEGLYVELSDKASCTDFFRRHGIRTPLDYLGLTTAPIPFVAKPIRNFDCRMRSLYPIIVYSEAQRQALLRDEDADEYFAQEYLAGRSFYLLSYFARDGTCYVSSQENILQQAAGKSILLAETSSFHKTPTAIAALELLRGRGFTGFSMVEFIDDGGGPCFIELNPRPWGPIQLCADHRCGIVEGFIGDWTCGDSRRFQWRSVQQPPNARYLWLGGIAQSLKRAERLVLRRSRLYASAKALRATGSDVYLRPDTLPVFMRELLDRPIAGARM